MIVRLSALLVGAVVACGAPAAPSPSPRTGLVWVTVEIERPAGFEVDPSMTAAPHEEEGRAGHPGHFSGQAHVVDVAASGGRLAAVGYSYPGWIATAWSSTDGLAWGLATVDGAVETTYMDAVAAGPERSVAFGRNGQGAAAWWSDDATSWRLATVSGASDGQEPCFGAVAAVSSAGFVAGGCSGPSTGVADARFWWSVDGTAWEPAMVDGAADGRVSAIAAGEPGLVAVGATGSVASPTGSVVWTSSDGQTWHRAAGGDPLDGVVLRSVIANGDGIVAVGDSLDGRRAAVLGSPDGLSWTTVTEQPAFAYHDQPIRMTDIVTTERGLVAVGHHLFGQQYGSATSWMSQDGATWERAGRSPVFPQGEMLAVTAAGDRVVAVGTYGAPDNFIPTVWISPPP